MKISQLFQPKSLIIAAFVLGVPVSVGAVATLTGLAATPASAVDVIRFDQKWLVSVDEARALIANGALVLDARDPALRAAAPLPHARPLAWQDLGDTTGRLLTDDALLTSRLRDLGVDGSQPIVVVADPTQGLGADAQVVWGLRSLGHARVVMVDGGLPALLAAGLPTIQPPFGLGNFTIDRQDDWSIDAADIGARRRDIVQLGAETAQELLTEQGALKTSGQIEALLAAKDIDSDTALVLDSQDPAINAWLAAILIDAGYNARKATGAGEYPLTAAN